MLKFFNILVVSAVKVNLGNGSFLLFLFHCILHLDLYYQAQIYKIGGKTPILYICGAYSCWVLRERKQRVIKKLNLRYIQQTY